MICRKCGAEIEGSVKFCGKCGAAISFEPPVQEKSIAEEIDSNSENKNKTRGKLAIIGVCSVILLFVVGFFAYRSIFGMSAKNQLARLDSDVNTLNESYAALYGKVDFYDNGFDSVPLSITNRLSTITFLVLYSMWR